MERSQSVLTLRLDTDFDSARPDQPTVLVLEIVGFAPDPDEPVRDAIGLLEESAGSVVEFMPSPVEGETRVLWFTIDYGPLETTLAFDSLSKRWEHPTAADLHKRVQRRAESYTRLSQRYEDLYRDHQALVTTLQAEAEREIDRSNRKAVFFRASNPVRAEAEDARMEVYERVRQIAIERKHAR